MTMPLRSNADEWHGQSNCSFFSFHSTEQPRWGHVSESARNPPSFSRTMYSLLTLSGVTEPEGKSSTLPISRSDDAGLLLWVSRDGFRRLAMNQSNSAAATRPSASHSLFRKLLLPFSGSAGLSAIFLCISRLCFHYSAVPRPYQVHPFAPEEYPGDGQHGIEYNHQDNNRLYYFRPGQRPAPLQVFEEDPHR